MLKQDFQELGVAGYNRVPICYETFADLDTPLSVYIKTANVPFSYLLESVHGGERFGRYSFIGLACNTRFYVEGNNCREVEGDKVIWEGEQEDPLVWIRGIQKRFKAKIPANLPRFSGGLVGYFGYETIRYIEKRLKSDSKADLFGSPDIMLLLSEELIVVDNVSGKLTIIVYANPQKSDSWDYANSRLKEVHTMLNCSVVLPAEMKTISENVETDFPKKDFINAVKRAKDYIVQGDIMQVVLSQRMKIPFKASPLTLYRALRALNPSPYMFYFDMDDFQIVGSSPEILVRLEDDNVTLRPIAGTRPRGNCEEEDLELEAELLGDPKELAEHVMLLDLGRNDVGRVAKVGSVKVSEKMIVERYSHVMHIVSNVTGKLRSGLDAIEVLRASFPAGTVSGAPKVRAMEIIEELEPIKRGIYSGAVGYIGFNGDMDVAIAIRTGLMRDNNLFIQAGAGIVADSIPESEWVETRNKAKAILRAAEIARSGALSEKFHSSQGKS